MLTVYFLLTTVAYQMSKVYLLLLVAQHIFFSWTFLLTQSVQWARECKITRECCYTFEKILYWLPFKYTLQVYFIGAGFWRVHRLQAQPHLQEAGRHCPPWHQLWPRGIALWNQSVHSSLSELSCFDTPVQSTGVLALTASMSNIDYILDPAVQNILLFAKPGVVCMLMHSSADSPHAGGAIRGVCGWHPWPGHQAEHPWQDGQEGEPERYGPAPLRQISHVNKNCLPYQKGPFCFCKFSRALWSILIVFVFYLLKIL